MVTPEYLKRIEEEIDLLLDEGYSSPNNADAESGILGKPDGPLIDDAIDLGGSSAKVYLFLWRAAGMDNCRKIYNSNNWTIKGIAGELHISRDAVSRAINRLLDAGLLQVIDEVENRFGSHNTIWGVTHPDWIENVRYAINMMGDLPSERLRKMRAKGKKVDSSGITEQYKDLSWLRYDASKQTIMEPAKPRTEAQNAAIQACLNHLSQTATIQ